MKGRKSALLTDSTMRIRVTFLAFGLVCILFALLFQTTYDPARWMTYRDADYAGERNFITYLSPGTKDVSTGTAYSFEQPRKVLLLIVLFGVFPFMLFLRIVNDLDVRLKNPRYITQWLSFVLARMGIFRVAGICPVKRYSLGVFPFMNCQSCELATGACPLGTFQMSLLKKQIPFLVIGQIVFIGITSGRTVCGWLCPYGFLSDIFDKLPGKRKELGKKFDYAKYIFLGLFVVSSIAYFFRSSSQTLFFCAFLCPTGFFYGVLEYGFTTGLTDMIKSLPFFHLMLVYHIVFALLIILGSIKLGGRLFCKYCCPLGTAYGLFGKIAMFGIKLNDNSCTNCMACIQVCPMKIDVRDQGFMNKSNCIVCGRCIKVCPTGKIEYSFSLAGGSSGQIKKKRPKKKKVLKKVLKK